MEGMSQALPAVLPTVLNAIGTGMTMRAQIKAGQGARDAANYEAAQLEQSAGQQVATGQHAALEEQRQAQIAQSRALVVAAASGGGASDPTVVNIIAKLAGEGAYRGMVDVYQGDEKARQLRDQAAATRYNGEQAYQNAKYGAISTAISGASSMYSKYAAQHRPNQFGLSYSPGAGYGVGRDFSNVDVVANGGFGIE